MTLPERLPMTPGRVIALVLGVPVALAVICTVAVSIVAEFGEDSIFVDRTVALPGPTAGVTVDNPDLTLSASAEAGRLVRIRGTLIGAFARPTFAVGTTATGVAVTSHCRVPTGTCGGNLHVTVPAGLPIVASDGSGNLDAAGLSGQISLSDGSGDLQAGRLSGAVSLSDGSGNITASDLSGSRVRISQRSGDIDASGLSAGAVTLLDDSGDITVSGLGATNVTGNAQSGDITLTFTKVPRRVNLTDLSGDITLVLPRGPAYYQVHAQTNSGTISVGVRRSTSPANVITAHAASGDITIKY
jgi:hypothetical protein